MTEGDRAWTRSVGPGDRVGRYDLEDELGAGGMAVVFRARDRELRRAVAIKVLFPQMLRNVEVVARFQREARAAASLEHPNILRVYDVGGGLGTGDPPYLVMELIEGQSLRQLGEARGPMLAEIVACIGACLAEALSVAHRAGIVHRDVKPANVMVANDGRVLLTDFGVARIDDDDALATRTGAILGTPAFMAPEQATGATVDGRSDVYSLGACLYQLATGATPYSGSTARIVAQIADAALVPALRRRPAVGAEFSRVIDRFMAREPSARPSDASAAATALRELAATGGFDDPRRDVERFIVDAPGFQRERQPQVIATTVSRARAAWANRQVPLALALADRASAMAPDDPAVIALVADVATRPRSYRGWLLGGALLAVGATAGGVALHGRSEPVRAAVTVDAGVAVIALPSTIDATPTPIDAGVLPVHADAGRIAQHDTAPRGQAAPLAPIDAAVASDAAALVAASPSPQPAHISITMDTWCDVSIDGVGHGRADSKTVFDVAAGHHTIACEQGAGLGSWHEAIDVAAGERRIVTGLLHQSVRVHIAVTHGDSVIIAGTSYRVGETVTLRPGRYRVDVMAAGATHTGSWVSVPGVGECTLRDTPNLDCFAAPSP